MICDQELNLGALCRSETLSNEEIARTFFATKRLTSMQIILIAKLEISKRNSRQFWMNVFPVAVCRIELPWTPVSCCSSWRLWSATPSTSTFFHESASLSFCSFVSMCFRVQHAADRSLCSSNNTQRRIAALQFQVTSGLKSRHHPLIYWSRKSYETKCEMTRETSVSRNFG